MNAWMHRAGAFSTPTGQAKEETFRVPAIIVRMGLRLPAVCRPRCRTHAEQWLPGRLKLSNTVSLRAGGGMTDR